jgi:hypothetical protein
MISTSFCCLFIQSIIDQISYIVPQTSLRYEAYGLIISMQPQSPYDPNQNNQPPQNQPVPPNYPGQATPDANHPAYDFIMNPGTNKASGPSLKLPGMSGLSPQLRRVIVIIVGLIFILIVLSVVLKAIDAPGNVSDLNLVIEDQQELLHLASEGSQVQNISQSDQNLTATATPVLSSSQAALKDYLAETGGKLNIKYLDLKESASTDQDLASAASAGTYDSTFDGAFQAQINTYLSDLNAAYKVTPGSRGKSILSGDYKQGKLLLTEISSQT